MPLLKILVEAVALIAGSILAAMISAVLAWNIARRLHCRRQAWLILLAAAATTLFAFGDSEFVRMSAILGIAASAALYLQGVDDGRGKRQNGIQRHR